MESITLLDKKFKLSINKAEIEKATAQIADKLNLSLANKEVVFVAILNGAFMFASDLFKKIEFDCKISFLKLASYEGTSSDETVKQLIGLNESLKDKTVIILEDIIDSGNTLDSIIRQVESFQPDEIRVATLLLKPDSYNYKHSLDFVGIKIPNEFVVGYGLDYNGYGRNLNQIYTLINQ